MDIALIGYGKMGKAIEQVALERGHQIALKISGSNKSAFTESNLQMADIAIEFSRPEAALENVLKCLGAGLPVVCGTTGWGEGMSKAKERCVALGGSFLAASNFSIGVNIFFEINKRLAELMTPYPEYDVEVEETHHLEKKDKPSGTAIRLSQQIISNLKRKKHWHLNTGVGDNPEVLKVTAHREADVPGTHVVRYFSEIDEIEIKHTAHSRRGFAVGAVLAAEFIHNRKGIFTMEDVLKNAMEF